MCTEKRERIVSEGHQKRYFQLRRESVREIERIAITKAHTFFPIHMKHTLHHWYDSVGKNIREQSLVDLIDLISEKVSFTNVIQLVSSTFDCFYQNQMLYKWVYAFVVVLVSPKKSLFFYNNQPVSECG